MYNRTNKDCFALIKTLLKICGISLNHKEKPLYTFYSVFVLSLNLYPFLQLIGAFRYLTDGEEIFEFSIFEAVTTLIFIKAVVLIYNRGFMRDLLQKLQNGVFVPNVTRGGLIEEVLFNNCVSLTNKQAIVYWAVVTITVIFAVLDAAFSRLRSSDYHDWRFEYGRVTMFNTTYSPNYEIASLYQNCSWFPIGWTFAVSDLLTVTVLAHITCQLKLLQNTIKRIMANSYKLMMNQNDTDCRDEEKYDSVDASVVAWQHIKPILKQAVEYHLAIINIADQIENAFHLLVLLIMLSGIVLIGSLLYKLNVLHVGGVMCLFCEIILICYWGNEVTLESQNVLQACYEVNFFGADLRLQRGVFLMMERSKKPIAFTAGKFSTLTLGTFLWIARTSYSYLMILRRVNQ